MSRWTCKCQLEWTKTRVTCSYQCQERSFTHSEMQWFCERKLQSGKSESNSKVGCAMYVHFDAYFIHSVDMSINSSICQPVYLYTYLPSYLLACLFACLPVHLPTCLPTSISFPIKKTQTEKISRLYLTGDKTQIQIQQMLDEFC